MGPCLNMLAQLPGMAKRFRKTVLRHIRQVKLMLALRTAMLHPMASPQPMLLLHRTNCHQQPNEPTTYKPHSLLILLLQHSLEAKAGP